MRFIAKDNEGNFFYNINKDKNQPSQDTAVQMRSGEGVVDNSAINVNISPNRENVNRTFYQENLNIAQENVELDKVNPKYEGKTINIDGVERIVYNSNGDNIFSKLSLNLLHHRLITNQNDNHKQQSMQ